MMLNGLGENVLHPHGKNGILLGASYKYLSVSAHTSPHLYIPLSVAPLRLADA